MEYSLSGVNRLNQELDIGEPWFSCATFGFVPPRPIKFYVDKDGSGKRMRAVYNCAYPLYRNDVMVCRLTRKRQVECFFFRLAENATAVIGRKNVADVFAAKNIPGVEFYVPEMWCG